MARRQVDLYSYLDDADSATKEWWKARQEIPLKLTTCAASEVRPHGICWMRAQSCGDLREAVLVLEELSPQVFEELHRTLSFMHTEMGLDFGQGMGFLLFCHVYELEKHSPSSCGALPGHVAQPADHKPISRNSITP